MKLPALLLAAAVALPSWAGDTGFDAVVRGIETECGVHRTRIPLLASSR